MNQIIMGNENSNKKGMKMPSNRIEVMKDVFYNSYRKLILLSMIIFIFTLPLFILFMSKNVYIKYGDIDFLNNIQINDANLQNVRVFAINFFAYTIAIPFIVLLSIVIGGTGFVIKKFVWNEVVDLSTDFRIGIKKTCKESAVFGLILGISLDILISNLYFLQINLSIPKTLQVIIIFISILQFIIALIVAMFSCCQVAIYQQKIRMTLKNSFLFTIVNLPKNILFLLITIFPYLFIIINVNFFFQVISYVLCGLIGFAFSIIIWTLYSHSIFDLYINRKYCPELVDKGIQRQ